LTFVDSALLNYQQLLSIPEPGFDEVVDAMAMFADLDKAHMRALDRNLTDNLKVAPQRQDRLRDFLEKHMPHRFAYSETQRGMMEILNPRGKES
jgi:hypothetical protein